MVEALWADGYTNVGTVLQSMLRRTGDDVERMLALGARVRLVKGAYQEPESVAYPDKADTDRAYVEQMKRLLESDPYPAIATHDEEIIDAARRFVWERGIAKESFEFQMLYGVRRDLQTRLREEGYNVRVYVPFGDSWYPYLMRRLAERPANVAVHGREHRQGGQGGRAEEAGDGGGRGRGGGDRRHPLLPPPQVAARGGHPLPAPAAGPPHAPDRRGDGGGRRARGRLAGHARVDAGLVPDARVRPQRGAVRGHGRRAERHPLHRRPTSTPGGWSAPGGRHPARALGACTPTS